MQEVLHQRLRREPGIRGRPAVVVAVFLPLGVGHAFIEGQSLHRQELASREGEVRRRRCHGKVASMKMETGVYQSQ